MKKIVVSITFLFIILSLTNKAICQDDRWYLIGNDDEIFIYVDKNSIRKDVINNIPVRLFWVKVEYLTPKWDEYSNKYINFFLEHDIVHCRTKEYKVDQTTEYFSDGTNYSYKSYKGYEYYSPDSFGETIYNYICDK